MISLHNNPVKCRKQKCFYYTSNLKQNKPKKSKTKKLAVFLYVKMHKIKKKTHECKH